MGTGGNHGILNSPSVLTALSKCNNASASTTTGELPADSSGIKSRHDKRVKLGDTHAEFPE